MQSTTWADLANPVAAGGLTSTAADYGRFLDAYYNGRLVSAATRAQMEADQAPLASRQPWDDGWHYGLANWFVCPDDPEDSNEWRPACAEEDVHQSGGVAGFRPTTNRKNDYWYVIAYEGEVGLGSLQSLALHYELKPLLDRAFRPAGRAADARLDAGVSTLT